ncbi:hypothetical protein ACMATS_12220 [Streptoverticillium reticulum]|uniref:hypothetical protein n=1 Tax=Streptoverticillium reticulum TaxID=1433415 RepID=UPI0039BFABCE
MRFTRPLAVTAAAVCGTLALGAGPAVAATAAQAVPTAVANDPWPPGTGDDDSSTTGLDDDSALDQFLSQYLIDPDAAIASALAG